MLDFVFLDARPSYDSIALSNGSMGGVQTGTILLAEALARRGHRVTVYNDRPDILKANGVEYRPVRAINGISDQAIVVSNNSFSIFDLAPTARKVVWARNNIVLNRLRRENAVSHLFKYKPNIVFPSHYAYRKTPWYFPLKSRNVIFHGVDLSFQKNTFQTEAPPPIAIFASQPIRNLKRVLKAWKKVIHPRLPNAELHLYYPKPNLTPSNIADFDKFGIKIMGSVKKAELAEAFTKARVMIYPGHRTETFCNVAAEALASGLPVATMGIGALKERVRHNIDGTVSWTTRQMGWSALRILTDDLLWLRLHRGAIEGSKNQTWDIRAAEWENAAKNW